MARKGIEIISPAIVFGRVVIGLALSVGLFLLWTPRTQQDVRLRWILIVIGIGVFVWGWRAVRDPVAAIRYHLNPRAVVLALVREWNPPDCRLESEYEKSLHGFLKDHLPFAKVTRQYGSARVKCDLAVDNRVMIELKAGFKSTGKLQRLIGQIDLFKREWDRPLLVVLLGKTEEDLLHELHKSARRHEYLDIITKEAREVAEVPDSQGPAT